LVTWLKTSSLELPILNLSLNRKSKKKFLFHNFYYRVSSVPTEKSNRERKTPVRIFLVPGFIEKMLQINAPCFSGMRKGNNLSGPLSDKTPCFFLNTSF
jgi:hypothetical protein